MTLIAISFVALYVVTSLVIVIPNNKITAPLAPLESAARPYFSQQWRVFAPKIIKQNVNLQVQAKWRTSEGESISSEWIDIAAIEQQPTAGHLSPSRATKSAWNAAQQYNSRYNKLNDEQKEVIRSTFVQVNSDGVYSARSTKYLVEKLSALGDNSTHIRNVLNYDAMLVQYTGTLATAYVGHDVEWVRWRIHRTRANDFKHRFQEEQQFKPSSTTFGWRQMDYQIPASELAVYQDLLRRNGAIK